MTPSRRRHFPCAALLALLLPLTAQATIRYEVSVAQREQNLFRVTMTIPDAQENLVLQLPAWNALYQIRDFAHRVQDVRAEGASERLALRKLDKQTWQVTAGRAGREVRIRYTAEWNDPSPFSAQINASHAFINLALVLMYVPERRGEDVRVAFTDLPPTWKAAVALKAGDQPNSFVARNYDALVDAPAELGFFNEFRFEARSTSGVARIRVVVHGKQPLEEDDKERLQAMIEKIVATQTGFMRDVPFEEFLFIYHVGEGGGGMEHSNSTAIHTGSLEGSAGLTAHEFFHLWNVKRIRPRSLEPVDYTRENWTRALWFAEGVTSTYASYTLVRSGLWTPRQFYDDLAGEIASLEARPARLWKSVEEASLDAWFEKYGGYRRPAYSISYYNKGQILGVLLDVLIREATRNRAGLDNVMRHLNEKYARAGRFYDDSAGIRAAVEQISGRSFEEFFARYVAGTDELACAEILAKAGLRLERKEGGRGYSIEEIPDAPPLARRIREGLLFGITDE